MSSSSSSSSLSSNSNKELVQLRVFFIDRLSCLSSVFASNKSGYDLDAINQLCGDRKNMMFLMISHEGISKSCSHHRVSSRIQEKVILRSTEDTQGAHIHKYCDLRNQF